MIRDALSIVVRLLSCLCLVGTIFLLVLTALFLSPQVAASLRVAPLALAVTAHMPAWLAFWGVLSSPLGGVFRTDFVVVALLLFVLGKVLHRIAKVL